MTTGKIVTLQNTRSENIFPETSAVAVYLNDGKTLEECLIRYTESQETVTLNNPDTIHRINNIESGLNLFNMQLNQMSYETEEVKSGIIEIKNGENTIITHNLDLEIVELDIKLLIKDNDRYYHIDNTISYSTPNNNEIVIYNDRTEPVTIIYYIKKFK